MYLSSPKNFGPSCCTNWHPQLLLLLENGCILTQDAMSEGGKKTFADASWGATFSCFFLFSFSLSCFHPLLTCGCLCLRVLHPGFKRNTVWTQQMPSKFLAASWLHGMEYFNTHFLWALKLSNGVQLETIISQGCIIITHICRSS